MSNRPAVVMPGENLLPSDADVDALVRAEHGDPFAILGPHADGDGLVIRAYLPNALSVEVLDRSGANALGSMEQGQVPGFFVTRLLHPQPYLLRIRWAGGEQVTEDPYSFGPQLGEIDMHLFSEGNHREIGRVFGAQVVEVDGISGVRFAVWAPNARRVSVVGDFNGWDGRRHPMRLRFPSGVWELFIPRLQPGDAYKYEILGPQGVLPLKADPVALATEHPPGTASVVARPLDYPWRDA
ncbi:MAG: GlgB N-terminal domain-containing protein, partial [Pseudomonadaceae bacterium]